VLSKSQRKVLNKFNKFLNGEIDMNGKSIAPTQQKDQKEEVKQHDNGPRRQIVGKVIERIHGSMENMAAVLTSATIGDAQEKALKDTLSWSTNVLLRYFYATSAVKSKDKLNEFLESNKEAIEHLSSQLKMQIRLEKTGFLTFIN
jgi:hypothetical protein